MPKDRGAVYGVPTEQQFGDEDNGTAYYQQTLGVYTSTQSSNSLVISGTGRTIYSNPGSPKSTLGDTLKLNQPSTSYCDSQLPLSVNGASTLVISDENHSAYCNASSNSNVSLVMAGMGGAGCYQATEDLPNEACNSRNSNLEKLRNTRLLMSQQSFPVDPLQGSDIYFQGSPRNNGNDFSAEALSNSVDVSVLADSNSAGLPGQPLLPNNGGGGATSMVTGVGGGGGGSLDVLGQPLFQSNQQIVFEDQDLDMMLREVMTTDATFDIGVPDLDLLKNFESSITSDRFADPLSTPVSADFINGFGDISIHPVQAAETPSGPVPLMGNGLSVQEEESTTGADLDIIKMMNVQLKPSAPASLGLKENLMVPMGHIPSPLESNNSVVPPSPVTPYTPNPPTPTMAPIQASVPSPAPPATPKTPCTSQKGPFELKSYVEDGDRVCEIGVQSELPQNQKLLAMRAVAFSWEVSRKVDQCLESPCDLKVAIDARAKLCKASCDFETAKLHFSMPKECMHIDKWLAVNRDKLDLKDRQLVVQQVINLLAALHTVGSDDKLCLWGSFVVWVAPNLQVHLLVDYPEMLAKMEQHAHIMSFDPRIEDVKAIYQLYRLVFQPFINQDSAWVSPGVKQLTQSFERLVMDPSSVYRMAELARTLGERRLCKLEVELMTLTHYVYCTEHEPLQGVLSHVTSMVPPVACDHWEVQWAESRTVVGRDVVASAHRRMQLIVQPVQQDHTPFGTLPQFNSMLQGLSFKSSCLPQF